MSKISVNQMTDPETAPALIDDNIIRVIAGLVDYAECNDPFNPWIQPALKILDQQDQAEASKRRG